MPHATALFAYDKQTDLIDSEITTHNGTGKLVHVSDTSALKALEKGTPVKELFKKAINIYMFSAEELYKLRNSSTEAVEKFLL